MTEIRHVKMVFDGKEYSATLALASIPSTYAR